MPANQITINLLNQEGSSNSPWNRIMVWITTYGRYIMITTELIVLLAFASRFSLDRKLTDLKENISQKQEILEVNVGLENDIRKVQNKLAVIKTILKTQPIPVETLIVVQTLMPIGTYLDTLSIDKNKVQSNISADTSDNFSTLLSNFSVSKKLVGVEIGRVNKQSSGIQFTLSALIQQPKIEETK